MDSDNDGARISLWDPEAQRAFDEERLDQVLEQVRRELSGAKVNRALAQLGLLAENQNLHPRQFDKIVSDLHKAIAELERLREGMDDRGIVVSAIEVASAIPEGSLAPEIVG